jgi:hypothetical protein
MKIPSCPRCHKPGFLTFRYIRKWNTPYVGHYDPIRYEKEKKDFVAMKRRSRPTGRKWCSITKRDVIGDNIRFIDDWNDQYLSLLEEIRGKYVKYGFITSQEIDENYQKTGKLNLKEIQREFFENQYWKETIGKASFLLSHNGLPKNFVRQRIIKDLFNNHQYLKMRDDDTWMDLILCESL